MTEIIDAVSASQFVLQGLCPTCGEVKLVFQHYCLGCRILGPKYTIKEPEQDDQTS